MAALIGGLLLVWNRAVPDILPQPPQDVVKVAFEAYEQLWRANAAVAAAMLENGQLATDRATRDWLSAQNQLARRDAFQAIATTEQSELSDWSANKHAELLRTYAQ